MKLLHVAPERLMSMKLSTASNIDYISGDLKPGRAMVQLDLTNIHYPDECFDVFYCSHVLEHVSDDRKSMRELHRILKRSGWGVLQVPIRGDRTLEDPSISDPRERERLFGQHDHVRYYGMDFQERLVEAGFSVERFFATDLADERGLRIMALKPSEDLFVCRRRA